LKGHLHPEKVTPERRVDKKLIAKWQGHQDGGQLIMDTYTEVFGSDDAEYEQQQLAKLVR